MNSINAVLDKLDRIRVKFVLSRNDVVIIPAQGQTSSGCIFVLCKFDRFLIAGLYNFPISPENVPEVEDSLYKV